LRSGGAPDHGGHRELEEKLRREVVRWGEPLACQPFPVLERAPTGGMP
jgi:hypothetical protein